MKGLTETFMKLLERMDALRFEEENKEARAKRKSLVDRIQVFECYRAQVTETSFGGNSLHHSAHELNYLAYNK